ncbi:MAG: hypothetical protein ABI140_04380 [Jatrophihabitantaceae bacterium]
MNRSDTSAAGGPMTVLLLAGWVMLGLIALVLLPVGQGVAGYACGIWIWPSGHVPTSISTLAIGRPGHGLPTGTPVPATALVYTFVTALEMPLIGAALTVSRLWWLHARPATDKDGFATGRQARDVLGQSRLQAGRSQVRPDLYPRSRSALGTGHHNTSDGAPASGLLRRTR